MVLHYYSDVCIVSYVFTEYASQLGTLLTKKIQMMTELKGKLLSLSYFSNTSFIYLSFFMVVVIVNNMSDNCFHA